VVDDNIKLNEHLTDLNKDCAELYNEVTYLKLREKKILCLVHFMQKRGYPVPQVYEQEI